jgi:hypothetical protein
LALLKVLAYNHKNIWELTMHKILIILGFSISCTYSFAANVVAESAVLPENHAFQEFDNQIYIGYGTTYGNLTNTYNQNSNYGTTLIGIGVERLFDMGLWLRFDGTLMTGYSNFNSSNPNALTGPLGQSPSVADLNIKVGYAFPVVKDTLLVTPYALMGRNTNLTSNSLNNNNASGTGGTSTLNANVTQDYFLTGGIGGRIEYRINSVFDIYFDQNALYNSERSGPTSNYTSATNYQLTSTLGAKFNVWDELQLGLNGFYTYNQLSGAAAPAQFYQLYQQNQVGGMVTVGLTY